MMSDHNMRVVGWGHEARTQRDDHKNLLFTRILGFACGRPWQTGTTNAVSIFCYQHELGQ